MNSEKESNFVMTQREVAQTLGIDRGLVAYIERTAIEKIKNTLEKHGIKPSDLLNVREK